MADSIGSRNYNKQKEVAAREVAERLRYQADQLLKQGMMPEHPARRHKWATGKEKWEAVQRAGRVAAGVESSGPARRGPKPASKEELTSQLYDQVAHYTAMVQAGDPNNRAAATHMAIANRLRSLAATIEPVDLQLLQAALAISQ